MLRGIRVLELGQVLSAPFAGAILGDLGAEVLKIERVDGGDDARRMGQDFRHGDAFTFHMVNRNKGSLALDLKSAQGKADFELLAGSADILIHNLRPGVPDDLAIDGPSLTARHPRLIYCAISAFGHIGPMRDRPGYEPLIQAYSGLSDTNGRPDDPPMRMGVAVCDQGTGMWIVIGALAALQNRAHRAWHHCHRLAAGNRPGLGGAARRPMGQSGFHARQAPLRPSRSGSVRGVRRRRWSVHHLLWQ